MKVCSKCQILKSIELFDITRRSKDGLRGVCKECRRKYRAANREKTAKYDQRYREANLGKIAKYMQKYRADNYKKLAEYYETNRCRFLEHQREYDASQPGGVYRLTCVPTSDVYFGSCGNLQKRRNGHSRDLRNKTHGNPRMRELSKSHEPSDFKFEIIIHCDSRKEGLLYEQLLIDRFPCCNARNTNGTVR